MNATQLVIPKIITIRRPVEARLSTLLAAIIGFFVLAGARPAAADEVCQRVLHGSVAIFNAQNELGCGACIDARQGLVVTAGHVVGDNAPVSVYPVIFDAAGRPITRFSYYRSHKELSVIGYVIRRDRSRDLAIVRLARIPVGLVSVPLAAQEPQIGDALFAIGNSGTDDDDSMWNYRDGRVRTVCHKNLHTAEGYINANMIETTIASNHGDSGGPVLNSRGELVAITITHHPNGAVEDPGQLIGFCTDVTEIRALLRELHLTIGGAAAPANLFPNAVAPVPAPEPAPVVIPDPSPSLAPIPPAAQVAPTVGGPSARIVGVDFSLDDSSALRFIAVHTTTIVTGANGIDCEVVCTACDENRKPLRDPMTGKPLQITQDICPGYDQSNYLDPNGLVMDFFPPLMQLYGGNHPYGFLVSVRIKATGLWITPKAFFVMCPSALQQAVMPPAIPLPENN